MTREPARPHLARAIDLTLGLAAGAVGLLLLARSLLRVDPSWDTWMYHLPFAARLWGIVPPELHVLPPYLEDRYRGVPLLGEWFQGALWWLTGRPETAVLPGVASLALFLWFLRSHLQVPWHLALLGLVAIPLVQIHASTAYVDLPANLAFSVLVLMTWLLYTRPGYGTRRNVLLMLLAAALAGNIKFQLVPLLPVPLGLALARLLWLARGHLGAAVAEAGAAWRVTLGLALGAALVFAVPLKNLALHGNPLYPLQVRVLGITLEGPELLPAEKEMASIHFVPVHLEDAPAAQRWLYSVAEVGIRPYTDPRRWTVDQFMPHGSTGTMMGGYAAPYVAFHLVLLAYLAWRLRSPESRAALAVMGLASAVSAVVPQSHELRYTLFWMVALVSLNLVLLGRLEASAGAAPLDRRRVGVALLGFLALTVAVTRGDYLNPAPYTVAQLIDRKVDKTIMASVTDHDFVCFSHEPWTFLYTAHFHPPLRYALKETGRREDCGIFRYLGMAKFGPD
jgi:hypothetical protein